MVFEGKFYRLPSGAATISFGAGFENNEANPLEHKEKIIAQWDGSTLQIRKKKDVIKFDME